MRDTFSEFLMKSPYHWYARPGLSSTDRKTVDLMRAAFKAGTKSDELDRAAELLRRSREDVQDWKTLGPEIDAFLRSIEG